MEVATILAIVSTIIQDTPAAIALFQQVKALAESGTEPTPAQWTALINGMAAAHAKVQA